MAKKSGELPDWVSLLIGRASNWLEEMIDQIPDAGPLKTDVPSDAPPPFVPPRGPTTTRDVLVLRNCARTVHAFGEDGRRLFNQLLAEIVFEETQRR